MIDIAFDPAYSRLSPGRLIHHNMIKFMFADPDIKIINFLGADPYKKDYANIKTDEDHLTAYNSRFRGF